MVLLASDFDQSKYLKASDLGPLNTEKRVKIKAVTVEKIGEKEEIKLVPAVHQHEQGAASQQDQLGARCRVPSVT